MALLDDRQLRLQNAADKLGVRAVHNQKDALLEKGLVHLAGKLLQRQQAVAPGNIRDVNNFVDIGRQINLAFPEGNLQRRQKALHPLRRVGSAGCRQHAAQHHKDGGRIKEIQQISAQQNADYHAGKAHYNAEQCKQVHMPPLHIVIYTGYSIISPASSREMTTGCRTRAISRTSSSAVSATGTLRPEAMERMVSGVSSMNSISPSLTQNFSWRLMRVTLIIPIPPPPYEQAAFSLPAVSFRAWVSA
ncbi:hypothetical protein SDC9_62144 [bioreactor metagenome]|uniref:Uncharacterized protein n=1 Tax=bioreactor metagenome TaxID=1076179 RepID=A0A644XHT0_9ZZZZ